MPKKLLAKYLKYFYFLYIEATQGEIVLLIYVLLIYSCSLYTINPSALTPVCSSSTLSNTYHHASLAQELFEAAQYKNASKFKSLLLQAEQQFAHNPQGFFKLMTTRDKDGYTLIMFFALMGDLENLFTVFQSIKRVFKNDTKTIFEILRLKDQNELNVLNQVIYNADQRIIALVIIKALDLLGHDKKLFYEFISSGITKDGWRPLVDAADDSVSEALTMLLQASTKVLGKKSFLFEKFINAQDQEGFRALDVAQKFRDQLLLIRYGAQHIPRPPAEAKRLARATFLGKELIAASARNNFQEFKKILTTAVEEFKDDESSLFNFFYIARDDAGWNGVLNVAANGQYEFLELLLNAMKNQSNYLKSLILTNVDFEGRSALHLAIDRQYFKVADLLLRKMMEYAISKPFFMALFNTANTINGFTPFMTLVYFANKYHMESYAMLHSMLLQLSNFLGKDSRALWLVLNARDYNGWNVLAYASDDIVRNLLMQYGAVDTIREHTIRELNALFNLELRKKSDTIIPRPALTSKYNTIPSNSFDY